MILCRPRGARDSVSRAVLDVIIIID